MEVSGDELADIVLKQFDILPQKRKPQVRGNGIREWVPLSGIIAQGPRSLKCVALGTGMKCLPQNKILKAQGIVLHDWHAEVVAIRSFNRFLLEECRLLALSSEYSSEYIRRRDESEIGGSNIQPFAVKDDISFHMYCSEAPCGDASMELTMAAQDDDTPWEPPSQVIQGDTSQLSNQNGLLQGRGYFSELGIVRRKPSRPDAPPTLSKSCSDKLALKQCTSLLSSLASMLVSPENAYISSLILPMTQYSSSGCDRAFGASGRMKAMKRRTWGGSYRFHSFQIKTTSSEFKFSRRAALSPSEKLVPSNLAAAWIPCGEETLIGGVLQGRKQFDPRGASILCKKNMWKLAIDVASLVGTPAIHLELSLGTYDLMKASEAMHERGCVKSEVRKEALMGWVSNEGDGFPFS